MIIKSFSRKHPSFGQLYDYINKEAEEHEVENGDKWSFNHNLFSFSGKKDDKKSIIEEFEKNASYLKQRAKSNVLYHEILSIKRKNSLSLEKQKDILFDLAHRYVSLRGEKLLAYGRIHVAKHHVHLHLMLSANEIRNPRRHRISINTFNFIRKSLENYLIQTYPELEEQYLYNQELNSNKIYGRMTDKEYQLKRRLKGTNKQTQKEKLNELLTTIFSRATSYKDIADALKAYNLTLYKRGKNTVIISPTGRKYRLKTLSLELDNLYMETIERIKIIEANKQKKSNLNQEKEKSDGEKQRVQQMKNQQEKDYGFEM